MKKTLFLVCFLLALMTFKPETSSAQWQTETPPAGKIALHRLRGVFSGMHIIATTGEANSLTQQVNSNGFNIWTYEGKLGYLQTAANTHPLYRYYKNGDNYVSLSSIAPAGYTLGGLLGYAAPVTGTYTSPVQIYSSIYQYYRKKNGPLDHVYTNDYNELGGGDSTWAYEGVAFNIWRF